jgi:hypothetical protein
MKCPGCNECFEKQILWFRNSYERLLYCYLCNEYYIIWGRPEKLINVTEEYIKERDERNASA